MSFKTAAEDFMAQKRIAVTGASSTKENTGNAIYKALRNKGYTVFPVHPTAKTIEGDPCFSNLKSIPGGVDGVFIVNRPEVVEQIVHDAVDAHVPRVWMHYNPMFGAKTTSVSKAATDFGREHGVTVIDGGCPLMFMDFPHRCMHWILDKMGKLPNPN
jgi:predicted CoA-binding protein